MKDLHEIHKKIFQSLGLDPDEVEGITIRVVRGKSVRCYVDMLLPSKEIVKTFRAIKWEEVT